MRYATQVAMIVIAGLGVGWLSGLSRSEVASSLVASLVAIIAGVFAGYKSGVGRTKDRLSPAALDAVPIALFILGVCVGVPGGIHARTKGQFGVEQKVTISEVTTGGKTEITKTTETEQASLHADKSTACEMLRASAR